MEMKRVNNKIKTDWLRTNKIYTNKLKMMETIISNLQTKRGGKL